MTASGNSALMVASQLLLAPGDRVVTVTPLWPNAVEIPKIMGGQVTCVSLEVRDGQWALPLEKLLQALTPDTRMLVLNSPNNPTGWTIQRAEQHAILEHCRRHGIWILADDVYERLIFSDGMRSAPSFLTMTDERDRLIVVNSFSKAWTMTGGAWAGWSRRLRSCLTSHRCSSTTSPASPIFLSERALSPSSRENRMFLKCVPS